MRKKLLLADDSITIQRVIELTFADEPVDVVAIGDGAAAIARLDAEPPDVVLADIGMPGQDGYAVAMHVRQTPALAHIPVVLLTGAFDPVDDARVREAGCAGVLVKPFDPQMLVARVRALLSPRSVSDAATASEAAEPPTGPALPRPADGGPASVPETRAIVVDKYFEQLDQAFAALGALPDEEHAPIREGTPAASAGAASRAEAVGSTPNAAAVASISRDGEPAADPPLGLVSRPPVASGHEATETGGEPSRSTLGDAFGALLALEQGQPAPDNAPRFLSPLTAHVVEQVAARVSREIAERVIRELAPEIVSQVAARLVREEIERLRAPATPG